MSSNGYPSNMTPLDVKPQINDKKILSSKRKVVGSACLACRKRKSKCNGELPACGACASVYGTRCVYDPQSDHRRKGVYRRQQAEVVESKRNVADVILQGLLSYPEDEISDLVARIRASNDLEGIAVEIDQRTSRSGSISQQPSSSHSDEHERIDSAYESSIERDLSEKVGQLRLENGALRFIGGTSNLLYLEPESVRAEDSPMVASTFEYTCNEDVIKSWTQVTEDLELILHLLQLYFTWHYPFHCILSKSLFFRDFFRGRPKSSADAPRDYCTPMLVNAMLALGCHFTTWSGARSSSYEVPGEHFFQEAKRLVVENEEFETPRLATVQALGLMSIREAGCSHESKGWIYSGMSFRMACEMGLHVDLTPADASNSTMNAEDIDARRMTFWGCFFFDKCWSNYLGRLPQLLLENCTTPKPQGSLQEDADLWSPRGDNGIDRTHTQPSKTRSVALQTSILAEISSDILVTFYCPKPLEKPLTRAAEVKRLGDFHARLEKWHRNIPQVLKVKDGQLPHVLLMHMFFNLLFIHLFRPFLKHTQSSSPLPETVSPRSICTQAAREISNIFRIYRKTYGVRQIPNIAIYIVHSACSIHLLGLPAEESKEAILHGISSLEEMAACWPSAARTIATLGIQARRWSIDLPKEIGVILARWEAKYRGVDSPGKAPSIPQLSVPPTGRRNTTNNTPAEYAMEDVAASMQRSLSGHEMAQRQQSLQSHLHDLDFLSSSASPSHTMHGPVSWTTEAEMLHPELTQPVGIRASTPLAPKDWWYQDQATIQESWSRRESSAEHFAGGSVLKSQRSLSQLENESGRAPIAWSAVPRNNQH